MHDASADVGSTAKTSPASSAAFITRRVTTPAPASIVATGSGAPGQRDALDRGEPLELLGVDDRRARGERDRAAGVAGAAAARNDREAELDAALDQAANLVLGVRVEHDERILDAPVGGVGHVRDAREPVERDVVLVRCGAPARAACAGAARRRRGTTPRSGRSPRVVAATSRATLRVARRVGAGARHAALLDLGRGGGAARRRAAAAASDCRAGRPAGTDCDRRPRCRPAPRTASAPSGPVRRSSRSSSSSVHISAPIRRMTISRSENDV